MFSGILLIKILIDDEDIIMLKQKTELKPLQQQILAPFLREELKILQLQNLQLLDRIDIELLENPALEEEGPRLESISTSLGKQESTYPSEEINWEEFFEDGKKYFERAFYNTEIEYEIPIASEKPTLTQALLNQLQLEHISHKERIIGELLISYIDENDGYFKGDLKEIAEISHASISEIEHVLSIIQTFEPPGVGARNLIECLNIQIQELGLTDSKLKDIINNYLEDVRKGNFEFISKELNITTEYVLQLVGFLKRLEPKPARVYSSQKTRYVIPDIIVNREGEITLNNLLVPNLKISSYCQSLLKNNNLTKEERKYIKDKLNKAIEFMKALENRNNTLYSICDAIFKRQKRFLTEGDAGLAPLTLSNISEAVKMHESTISRSISNKYVKTPLGTFPLKYFFVSGIKDKSGVKVSSVSIKRKIKEIISNENKKPLSDSEIVDKLKEYGISIARRTVAKYREELGIPPVSRRKEKLK
jgi:RNA polymerase sigma-54 factor